jgi:prepilin-type N-terminal cleavage/methylation domain-containing protein
MNQVLRIKNLERGFTLIELLVVIAIIGVLSTLLMVNFIGVRQRGRDAQRKSDFAQLRTAFEQYRTDVGTYPPSLPACGSALTSGSNTYMQKIPCDPLNSGQLIYHYTTGGTTYSLIGCLENVNDSLKDAANNATYCSGTSNWSYTLTNP